MPSRRNAQNYDYNTEEFADPPTDLLDEPVARPSRKKSKHAKQTKLESPERSAEREVASERSPSPPPVPTVPQTLAHRSRLDVLEELSTEKVSDDHTPPQTTYLRQPSDYGRSPPPDLLPGFTHRPSPPVQNYLGGGGFNAKSPPTSPPQAKARPVSYGGPPSIAGYSRNSPSPYAYTSSAFGGSPPPPHMPQGHFYHAQDIDLGLGRHRVNGTPANFIKFASIPNSNGSTSAILMGAENCLTVMSSHGDKISHLGRLDNLPGVVHDATILTWGKGSDPFATMRPLVALTLHGIQSPPTLEEPHFGVSSRRASTITQRPDMTNAASTTVSVYSIKQQIMLTTLLQVPPLSAQQIPAWMDRQASQLPTGRLRVQASGNHTIVSSGVSGEIYVFGIKVVNDEPHFVCLEKLWTSLQPRMQRRDSSHTRAGEAGISPADLASTQNNEEQPIVSLNGRWIAYCPVLASRPSLGAYLGENILCSSSPAITSRSAPARPAATCSVDSPDVETMLGRVAKGVAQEVLKGGKWLGEKGVQAWQSYWSQDASNRPSPSASPVYSPQPHPSFPPTHGEAPDSASKEPEVVSIIDLNALDARESRKHNAGPVATFQPPGGCSYLSFAPNGLTLLTASRRGDIYYIWDLFQMRYPHKAFSVDSEKSVAKVRQIAKNERFSESVVIDLQWEAPLGTRYAVLTQNRTVHMFDMPASAWRWPPPRARKRQRPVSVPLAETTSTSTQQASGFFSSAMSFANSRAQPMLANLRGRTPSMASGAGGIGNTGFGLASATGLRGGKVVAAGFSKSLGAATDTVANIRHAGQSKLRLKNEAIAGRLAWTYRDHRPRLSILDLAEIRSYYVRKTNPRERQPGTVSVFDSRKVVNVKISAAISSDNDAEEASGGFWHSDAQRQPSSPGTVAPLSFAEIETNAPYQPFHSDSRVTISVYAADAASSDPPTASAMFTGQPPARSASTATGEKWLFGQDIPTIHLNVSSPEPDADPTDIGPIHRSVVYRETTLHPATVDGEMDQIVSTTRRRKGKKGRLGLSEHNVPLAEGEEPEEGFFEDDCDVLDFAEDRV